MRSSALFASLIAVVPSVLAAVVPTSDNMVFGRALTASDADVDVAARLTTSSEAPSRRQAEPRHLTLEDIHTVIKECQGRNTMGVGGKKDPETSVSFPVLVVILIFR